MHATFALLALAAAGASAQGVAAGTLKPTAASPAGCSGNYNGKFQITIVKAAMKRDLEARQSSCNDGNTLVASLANGVLTDAAGRIGGIVANRQFQFDGPPSQTGTIYNGGWSVCNNGSLAIGGTNVFYQCLSGSFYNLYDQSTGAQCQQVLIDIIPCSGAAAAAPTGATQIPDGQIQASSAGPRPVTQISDGQIQATTAAPRPVSQISDGQIQATAAATASRPAPVSQIPDGQIQATTLATRPAPVSQISDGQIQATKATTRAPVSQISDGQIQATTAASRPAPVSQISDGQIQATTAASRPAPVSQISDGQIQATTAATRAPVSQISDGQIQATTAATVTRTSQPAAFTGAGATMGVGALAAAGAIVAALL